jgi:hypothetical protein
MSLDDAERVTKDAAEDRMIRIELTDEQHRQLSEQYAKLNPSEAAQLVFVRKGVVTSQLKVAGYSYHGDTCCV